MIAEPQTMRVRGDSDDLLVWFYVTGFAFLEGGEINVRIEHAAARHGYPEVKPPGEKAVSEEKRADRRPPAAPDIAAACPDQQSG